MIEIIKKEDLAEEIWIGIRDLFEAQTEVSNEKIIMNFSNGQVFEVTVAERS